MKIQELIIPVNINGRVGMSKNVSKVRKYGEEIMNENGDP